MDSKKDIVSSTGRPTHETTPEEKRGLIRIPWQKHNPLPWFFEGSSIYDAKLQLIFCGVKSDLGRFIVKAANDYFKKKETVDCPECCGSGYEYSPSNSFDAEPEVTGRCFACNGSGEVTDKAEGGVI